MSFSFSLGPFQVLFRRKDSVPKPLVDEAKVASRLQSGGYDRVPEHKNHERLAQASQLFGDAVERNAAAARAKAEAQRVAEQARAGAILQVLSDSDAVDLVELVNNQVKAESSGKAGYDIAICLGSEVLRDDGYLKGDVYLYAEREPRRRDSHFQDDNRVVIGVQSRWAGGLRQVHLSEVEAIDPEKLRARLQSLSDKVATDKRVAPEDWKAL